MKVLLWSQYFWPENFRINSLAVSLQNEGVDVTVLTGKPNYPEGKIFPGYRVCGIQREQFEGAEVVRIPLAPRGKGSPFRLAINYLSFIVSGYVLAPFALRGRDFDLVFVYTPSPLLQTLPAILLSWLKSAPLVVWVQDLWPESLSATGHVRNRWIIRGVKALVRHIYRHADSILIQSEAFREPVARLTDDPQKIRYYPNSSDEIDCGTAKTGTCPGVAADMKKTFSIVFAGNIGTAQAMETVVGAAEMLQSRPGIEFYIVGSGSQSEWLAQEISRKRLNNIHLTGRFPYTDMPGIFAAASALLVILKDSPCLAATTPSKLQAYLAAGKPIIASLNGEGARIVKEAEAGMACPAEDAGALAETVLKLYEMTPGERARLGENGRRYFFEHFEATRLARELIEHFRDISRRKGDRCR